MRVILDTTFISNGRQSAYGYLRALIPRLQQFPDVELEVLESPLFKLPKEVAGDSKVHSPKLPGAPKFLKGPVRKVLAKGKWAVEKFLLARSMSKGQAPIFHTYFYTPPPSTRVRLVANALDLIPEKFGKEFGTETAEKEHLRRKELCFRRATRIIAISEATKQDLIDIYGIPEGNIDVSYLSIDPDFSEPSTSPVTYPERYILQVGGRQHHKNFSRLLEAFAMSSLNKDYLLVSAGEPWNEEEKKQIDRWGMKNRVVGAVNPTKEQLKSLYQSATMVAYPSLYEGFGVPLLEAMATGVPIATSLNSGSIPEVAADAAEYFDARNPADIARAMEALTNKDRAEELVQKGYANLKRFSWQRMAEETHETYAKVDLSVA